MKKRVVLAVVLIVVSAASTASAQRFLEQLEEQVRQGSDRPSEGPPAAATAPARPESVKPEAAPAVPPPPAPGPPKPNPPTPGPSTAGGVPPERGYLGITTDDRLDRGRGVRILSVRPGGQGERAGLRAQDLITGLGGMRVRQMDDLVAILDQVSPGAALAFDILRGQQPLHIEATFGRRPSPSAGPAPDAARANPQSPAGPALTAPGVPDAAAGAPDTAGRADPPSDRERIEALERRLRQLEERLQQLERAMLRRE